MFKIKGSFTTAILICILLMFNGCGVLGNISIETTEQKYVAARAELNIILKQYIDVQYSISEEDHKIVKKAFYDADIALDAWEAFLDTPMYNYQSNLQSYLDAKNIIMEVLRNEH